MVVFVVVVVAFGFGGIFHFGLVGCFSFLIIIHNVSITLVGSTISPTSLNNFNTSTGKNDFDS